jgi:NAD(P)-dependent dehydrogenase (short-subunit alcohol dehydrogenase family)
MDPFDLPIEAFNRVNALNLQGTVLPTLVFGPLMAKTKKTSIINISSMAAMQAITRVVAYSTGKAGIDAFTRWMAL